MNFIQIAFFFKKHNKIEYKHPDLILFFSYEFTLIYCNISQNIVDEDKTGLTDVQIHDRDMDWLNQSDGKVFTHRN